jgi:DNA-binding beta-propeller fold protein YncE
MWARTAVALSLASLALAGATQAAAAPGALLWAAHNGAGVRFDQRPVAVAPDASAVFTAGHVSEVSADLLTLAYDRVTGRKLWRSRFDAGCSESIAALVVSPDSSRVYVTGDSECFTTTTTNEWVTVAYDARSGERLWARHYGQNGRPFALEVAPDGGRVFVTGFEVMDGAAKAALVAYDTSSGARLWERIYRGASRSVGRDIGVDPTGSRVFVTGTSCDADFVACKWLLLASVAASGANDWARQIGPASVNTDGRKLAVSPDGSRIFMTGVRASATGGGGDVGTIAFHSADGSIAWSRLYDGPTGAYDEGVDIGATPEGNRVVVTGNLDAGDSYDIATIAYDARSGMRQWARRFDSGEGSTGSSDNATALAIRPDGTQFYVTGRAYGDRIATLAYSSSGHLLWHVRYRSSSEPTDIAVAPGGGRVFVAGFWYQPELPPGLTLAYITH